MYLDVALVQFDATDDVDANIERALALTDTAAAAAARLIGLPEYLQFRGADEGFRASARPIPGPFTNAFAEVARRRHVWILSAWAMTVPAADQVGIITARIETDRVAAVRRQIPVLSNRRPGAYPLG